MRNMIFIIAGLGIGLVASFYYISHSLNSLSSEPAPITIEHLLSVTEYDQLRELREAKVTELATILQSITDGQSARENLHAAQESYMQLELINTRMHMFPAAHTQEQPKGPPDARLLAECQRLQKSPITAHELRSILLPLTPQTPRPATVLLHP